MTPIAQTRFGEEGNCWQAAIATMLDRPLEDVPDFVNERDGVRGPNDYWFQDTAKWLNEEGLRMFWVRAYEGTDLRDFLWPVGYHIKGGTSPRGLGYLPRR